MSEAGDSSGLAQLLGPGLRWAVRRPGAVPASALHPAEAQAVARAVDKRRLEMAAGRDAARAPLAALGLPPATIPRGERGAPVWPSGVIGSITHTDDWCLAAVAREGPLRSLGIDAEPDGPLEPDLWPAITTADELVWLRAIPAEEAGGLARRLFCAKEAAYKCQYPLSREFLEFDDLAIRFSEPNPTTRPMMQTFDAVYQRDVPGFASGATIGGRLLVDRDRVVAVALVGPEHGAAR